MRCSVVSSAGQVLATGQLFVQEDDSGELRLSFRSDRGRVIEGGAIDADGSLMGASQELFRGFFQAWGMSGMTLTVQVKQSL